ncbi:hypothetical protein [Sorangium cellulosum]|nr:hypothetical protein [Sorangium cellulosum]
MPSLCLAGNTCVDNRCVLECSNHLDCRPDQVCGPAQEDDTNDTISVCQPHGKPQGYGAPCPFGNECGQYGSCPDGSACNLAQCDNNLADCRRDTDACGGDDPNCTLGKCSNGKPCVLPTCDAAACTSLGLECRGQGEGDAEAYCTQPHCASDADCADGYECALTRDAHAICGTEKGDNSFCGETEEECVDPAAFNANGNQFIEGSVCLLRTACIKRAQCAPCESDLDCSRIAGQRCVSIGGEDRCARTCNNDEDCELDYQCTEGACIPRFGACVGDGGFCEPCRNDNDCGGVGTLTACVSTLRGQRACLDFSARTEPCTSDDDCPESPSGRHGACLADGSCSLPMYKRDPRDEGSVVQSCW